MNKIAWEVRLGAWFHYAFLRTFEGARATRTRAASWGWGLGSCELERPGLSLAGGLGGRDSKSW